MSTSIWESLLNAKTVYFLPYFYMSLWLEWWKKYVFEYFEHSFTGQNTQHLWNYLQLQWPDLTKIQLNLLCEKTFLNDGAHIWNFAPDSIKTCTSLYSSKRAIKSIKYFNLEVWHLSTLHHSLKNQLLSHSAKAIKICTWSSDVWMLSFKNQ